MLGTASDEGDERRAGRSRPRERSRRGGRRLLSAGRSARMGRPERQVPGARLRPASWPSRSRRVLHVSADDPPTLLIHGDKDDLVKLDNSERIVAELKKEKVPCDLIVIEGAGHGFAGEAGQAGVAEAHRVVRQAPGGRRGWRQSQRRKVGGRSVVGEGTETCGRRTCGVGKPAHNTQTRGQPPACPGLCGIFFGGALSWSRTLRTPATPRSALRRGIRWFSYFRLPESVTLPLHHNRPHSRAAATGALQPPID